MSVFKKVTCRNSYTPTQQDIDRAYKCHSTGCNGKVPYSDHLYYYLKVFLNGKKDTDSEGYVYVVFQTNNPVTASITLRLASNDETYHAKLNNETRHVFGALQEYDDEFRDCCFDNYATMYLTVEFDVYIMALNHRFYESCEHVEKDFVLVVDNTEIKVHRHYLALISPVFNAMLSHRTKEAKSKRVEIEDFDLATVDAVIRLCYGYFITEIDVPLAINMLRFIDKYDIKSPRIQLEYYLKEQLTAAHFPAAVKYAYDHSREELMASCGTFYMQNQVSITKLREFVDLDPQIISCVLKAAWKAHNDNPDIMSALFD